MAILAILVFVFGLFFETQPLPKIQVSVQNNEAQARSSVADDSLKLVRKDSDATANAAAAPAEVDRPRAATAGVYPCDPEARRASSNTFATWTRERVKGYNMYELDSMELRRIGLVVADNGTVWRTKGNRAEGMQETERRESTIWFVQGVFKSADPVDSAWLAKQFEKGEPYAKLHGVNHPIQVAEKINVEPVLVTNSKGYTFSHTYDISNPGNPSAIGSGKYKGRELVAIRVPYKGPIMPTDTVEYFYIYWYEPSQEFLSLLPPSVRQDIAQRNEDLRTSATQVTQLTGALATSSLHPNPVTQDVATLDYTLREKRRVAVSLYDISGERVRSIAVSGQRDPGACQENISLAGIPDGYYLLAVTTDNGEQIVHPMLLRR